MPACGEISQLMMEASAGGVYYGTDGVQFLASGTRLSLPDGVNFV